MKRDVDPQPLSRAISDLVALRGWARVRGDSQMQEAWNEVAGPAVASRTRARLIKRGVLQVGVGNAPLLSELVSFHRGQLVERLAERNPELRIKDIKFQLDSDVGT
jgi:hypothetical protein